MRAILVFPGRGSYRKEELGSLEGLTSEVVGLADELRAGLGRPTVSEMDASPEYRGALHLAGENASILTSAISLADAEQLKGGQAEIVAVVGNSMGWYSAVAHAGALPMAAGLKLVEQMASYQKGNVIGGQMIMPLCGEDWVKDEERARRVLGLVAEIDELHVSIQLGVDVVLGGSKEALTAFKESVDPVERGAFKFPLELPLHSAFHTPLLADTSAKAAVELADLPWSAPATPLVDGRGHVFRPGVTSPAELRDYTLGVQVTETYDFLTGLRVALREYAPEKVILPGPGSNLGGAIAQTLIAEGWCGLKCKQDFLDAQKSDPILLSMRREDQRKLL